VDHATSEAAERDPTLAEVRSALGDLGLRAGHGNGREKQSQFVGQDAEEAEPSSRSRIMCQPWATMCPTGFELPPRLAAAGGCHRGTAGEELRSVRCDGKRAGTASS